MNATRSHLAKPHQHAPAARAFARTAHAGIAAMVAGTLAAPLCAAAFPPGVELPVRDDAIDQLEVELSLSASVQPSVLSIEQQLADAEDGTELLLPGGIYEITDPSIFAGRLLVIRSASADQPARFRPAHDGSRILELTDGADVTFEGVHFEGGHSAGILPGEFGGGAILIRGSRARFESCLFTDGRADSITREGAGGALLAFDATLEIVETRFADSSADLGGALAVRGGSLLLLGSRFEATEARAGGALHIENAEALVFGNTFTEVSAEGFFDDPSAGSIVHLNSEARLVAVEGNEFKGGSARGAVIDNASMRPVELRENVICAIEAPGVDGPWFDLGGNRRCGLDADLNLDGRVDQGDLSVVLGHWGWIGDSNPPGDVNRDGEVNGADLQLVLGAWGDDDGVDS